MKHGNSILHFDDINQSHEMMGFVGRTDIPDFHVFTLEDTYPSTRRVMPPYTLGFYCIMLLEGNSHERKGRLELIMTTLNISAPIALVTGASHGIGFEVVRQLAQRGMTVILTARNSSQGTTAAERLIDEGLTILFKPLDVTNDESVNQLATEIGQQFGRLDILINNAATNFDYQELTLNTDLERVRTSFETNLFGAWRMSKAFLPLLQKSHHARIVNVGSGAGSFGAPEGLLANRIANLPAYTITKLALNGFTLKLAAELSGSGILVNSVCPGTTASYPGMENIPGARPIQQGAASIIWAALLPDDGPTGGFFRDGKPLSW